MAILLPSLSTPHGPTANTLASFSSLRQLSGRKIPPAVLLSALILCTSTRSRRGIRDLMLLSADVCICEGQSTATEILEQGSCLGVTVPSWKVVRQGEQLIELV